jgi:hypothetical protein
MKPKECPSKDEIIRFFEDTAGEGDGGAFHDHARSCPECRVVFEAVREIRSQSPGILGGLEGLDLRSREARRRLREEARREILGLRRSRRPKRLNAFGRFGIPAVGAAVALLAIFVIVPNIGTHRTNALERNGSPLEIGLLRPRGAVPASALTFAWTRQPEALSYRLEIYDRTLEPVYRSGPLDGSAFALPGDAAALIRRNEVYFWKVVADFKDSPTIQSEFAKFILQN